MTNNLKQSIISEKEEKHLFVEKVVGFNECEYFDVLARLPFLQERVFSHVSNRLLEKYQYLNENNEIRLTLFVDLLVQAREIYVKSQTYNSSSPSFISGEVVLPDDTKDEIVVVPNHFGKLTIKLNTDTSI